MKFLARVLLLAILASMPAMASPDTKRMPQAASMAAIQLPGWFTGKGIKTFWKSLVNIFFPNCKDAPKTLVLEEDAVIVPIEHLTDGSLPEQMGSCVVRTNQCRLGLATNRAGLSVAAQGTCFVQQGVERERGISAL